MIPDSVRMQENTDQSSSKYGHYLLSVCYMWIIMMQKYVQIQQNEMMFDKTGHKEIVKSIGNIIFSII